MSRRFHPIMTMSMALMIVISFVGRVQITQAKALAESGVSLRPAAQPLEQPLAIENIGENVDLLGHLGGMAQTVYVQGQYAYAGFGPEFAILDVSDPAHIQRVSWLVSEGEVEDIDIGGDYAYIAYQGENLSPHYWANAEVGVTGLQIVDIRHPTIPVVMATMQFAECGRSPYVVTSGSDAYLGYTKCSAFGGIIQNAGAYLHRLDISDPSNPTSLAEYSMPMGAVEGLAVVGDKVYSIFTDFFSTSMKVFDVTSPSGLVETGSTSIAIGAQGIVLSGDYAFLAAGVDGLQIVDIGDPSNPTPILTHTVSGEPNVISIQGTTVYLGTAVAQILSVDVSDPHNPIDSSAYDTIGPPTDLAISGESLFSANGWEGIEIQHLTDLSIGGFFQLPTPSHDMVFMDSYALSATDDGLWVVDISDPSMPVPVAHLITLPAVSISLVGNYAYLACPGDGLRIIDVSNPLAPAEAGYYGNPAELTQVVWSGNYLIVAAGPGGLQLLDLSNPLSPSLIGAFDPNYSVNAAAVKGNYAYLAADNGNLVVVDISDPANPIEAGIFDPPDWYSPEQIATSIQVNDQVAYLAVISPPPTPLAGYFDGAVFLVDVSNPEEPVQLGTLPTDGYGWAPTKIDLDAGRAYVAYEQQGLGVYDTTDPTTPVRIGGYDTSENIAGVSISGESIYLYNKSVFILHYIDPILPTISGWVKQANRQPYPGALVSTGNPVFDKVTNLQGEYSMRGLTEGTYTLIPSLPGYVFSPTSRIVDLPPSAWTQNFTILPEPVSVEFTPGISTTLLYTDTQGLPTWLDIPADASGAPMILQVVPTVAEDATGYTFAGHAFELIEGQGGGLSSDFVFDSPITVTIQYSTEDTAVVSNLEDLSVWWWNGSTWLDALQSCSPASAYNRDTGSNTLSVPICETGTYKLMGPTNQAYLPLITYNR